MKLDAEFVKEIKSLSLSRNTIREIAAALEKRYDYVSNIKKYGRAAVAVCTAATISSGHGYERTQIAWAYEVLRWWKPEKSSHVEVARFNLHPAILADNSASLRKITTLDACN